MTDYTSIDPIIYSWASDNQLHVSTQYRDEEVRSITVVNGHGREFQIWIEAEAGGFRVNAALNHRRTREQRRWSSELTTVDSLRPQLDAALRRGRKWVADP